ncbi:syntaxin-8 isoform X5 [Meleagris gallopavo]|uniref:syntaxin-8 isoform X5 n=1 Tax=Meleagris gallopavo TaxID=9103 RepID=UPI00093FA407|nr:syntaxin-8 isoform X5 [Meleagris gallopavo]
MAPDPWLSQYDAACQLAQEVAERIQERSRHRRNGESSAKLNVIIRSSLQNLKEKIDQLKDSLLRAVSTHQITQLEGDRRQNLVDDLLTRQKQLQASYKNEGTEPDVISSCSPLHRQRCSQCLLRPSLLGTGCMLCVQRRWRWVPSSPTCCFWGQKTALLAGVQLLFIALSCSEAVKTCGATCCGFSRLERPLFSVPGVSKSALPAALEKSAHVV